MQIQQNSLERYEVRLPVCISSAKFEHHPTYPDNRQISKHHPLNEDGAVGDEDTCGDQTFLHSVIILSNRFLFCVEEF
jgi:hypothetical protein